jgi:hypothetical protein
MATVHLKDFPLHPVATSYGLLMTMLDDQLLNHYSLGQYRSCCAQPLFLWTRPAMLKTARAVGLTFFERSTCVVE